MPETIGFREPPEGVVAGETVPVENDQADLDRGLVDEYAALLKTRPGYNERSMDELREIAKEKLQ